LLNDSYVVVAPDWVNDGHVTFECHEQNPVRRREEKAPERESRQPIVTNEQIANAVT